jgi:hypothetical protein
MGKIHILQLKMPNGCHTNAVDTAGEGKLAQTQKVSALWNSYTFRTFLQSLQCILNA